MMADAPGTTLLRMAIASQLVILIYFTIDNHVDVYPWNNLRSPSAELPSTLAGWIPFLATMAVFALRLRWARLVGTVCACVGQLLQIRQLWVPYFFGSTRLHRDFSWYYEHGYAETLKVLPQFADRPLPDVQHMMSFNFCRWSWW